MSLTKGDIEINNLLKMAFFTFLQMSISSTKYMVIVMQTMTSSDLVCISSIYEIKHSSVFSVTIFSYTLTYINLKGCPKNQHWVKNFYEIVQILGLRKAFNYRTKLESNKFV